MPNVGQSPAVTVTRILRLAENLSEHLAPDRSIAKVTLKEEGYHLVEMRDGTKLRVTAVVEPATPTVPVEET